MKITRVELIDYKCFDHLILDQLGDRVVLVGPNGSGKSAILEAIATVKEYVASYEPDAAFYQERLPVLNKHTYAWKQDIPLPIRANQSSTTIKFTIALNDKEREFADGYSSSEVEIGIKIDRSREVTFLNENKSISKLLRQFDAESGVGVFDYISPNRQFPIQQVTNLDLSKLSLDQQRRERIQLPGSKNLDLKFSATKYFIIAKQLDDLTIKNATDENVNSIALLQELFRFFFAPKELIGGMQKDNEFKVIIRTPYGDHDIDQLSSGEKELFSILVSLFRIRDFNTVVLYDEPERHLNPGLESKLIPALNRIQTNNQLWIATHGTELIGSVPMNEIISLSRQGEATQVERFIDESKAKRIRIQEALGAKIGLQLSSNRIVFLEGNQSHADKRILDKLIGPKLPGVLFVASGTAADVQGSGTRAALLLEYASQDAAFLMVLDRDYRDENSVKDLSTRLKDRVFVWNHHEVENLLLNSDVIHYVSKFNGYDSMSSTKVVYDALLKTAEDMAVRFSIELATYRLHTSFEGSNSGAPRDEADYWNMIQKRADRYKSMYSKEVAISFLESATKEVQDSLKDGSWISLLPGKEILDGFRKAHLLNLHKELFQEQMMSRMIEIDVFPEEVNRLCEFINLS